MACVSPTSLSLSSLHVAVCVHAWHHLPKRHRAAINRGGRWRRPSPRGSRHQRQRGPTSRPQAVMSSQSAVNDSVVCSLTQHLMLQADALRGATLTLVVFQSFGKVLISKVWEEGEALLKTKQGHWKIQQCIFFLLNRGVFILHIKAKFLQYFFFFFLIKYN